MFKAQTILPVMIHYTDCAVTGVRLKYLIIDFSDEFP